MLTLGHGPGGSAWIAGRLDAAQAALALQFFDAIHDSVTLDCARLDYVSSAGLGVLLQTQKRLHARGATLRLRGLSAPVHDVFCYAGFDQIFEIEPAG